MEAGKLRHWLTFQVPVDITDSDGATVEDWAPAFAVNSRMPCEVTDMSGGELLAAQAIQSKVSARIRTRYRPGFAAKQRAVGSDGQIWNIEAVIADPASRREFVTLLVSSGVNEG